MGETFFSHSGAVKRKPSRCTKKLTKCLRHVDNPELPTLYYTARRSTQEIRGLGRRAIAALKKSISMVKSIEFEVNRNESQSEAYYYFSIKTLLSNISTETPVKIHCFLDSLRLYLAFSRTNYAFNFPFIKTPLLRDLDSFLVVPNCLLDGPFSAHYFVGSAAILINEDAF